MTLKRDDLKVLSQILQTIEIALVKLEKSYNEKDIVGLEKAKKEIKNFQIKFSEILAT